jgi:ferredoxin
MDDDLIVEVDRDICVMAQNCSLQAPKTFTNDSDGIVVLGDPRASSAEELEAAEYNCPSGAIQLRRRARA